MLLGSSQAGAACPPISVDGKDAVGAVIAKAGQGLTPSPFVPHGVSAAQSLRLAVSKGTRQPWEVLTPREVCCPLSSSDGEVEKLELSTLYPGFLFSETTFSPPGLGS